MSLFVNSVTEKFLGRFTELSANYGKSLFTRGKKFVRSIFSSEEKSFDSYPAVKKLLERKDYSVGNYFGVTKEQIVGIKQLNIREKEAILRTLKHEPPKHTTIINPVRAKLTTIQGVKAQFESLVKRDKDGVIILTSEECRGILPKLNPKYVRLAQESLEKDNEHRRFILSLSPNDIRRKMAKKPLYLYKMTTPRDVICRYNWIVENEIRSLKYKLNHDFNHLNKILGKTHESDKIFEKTHPMMNKTTKLG